MKRLIALVGLMSISFSASAEVDYNKLASCSQKFLAEYEQVLRQREGLAVKVGLAEVTATTSGEFAQLATLQSSLSAASSKVLTLDQKFDAAKANGRESENMRAFCREYGEEL